MGIFTRLRDIVNSNINAMLDRAEDPEKLLRLMHQEMEDTLIEIKAQCAAAMADAKTYGRQAVEAGERGAAWEGKARLAVEKGREDLAREALLEKRRLAERTTALQDKTAEAEALVERYRADIEQLEEKIQAVREKQRLLVQRHQQASSRKRAQNGMRQYDTADALGRFESFERRVDRLEAEADLVNAGRKPSLDEEFATLEGDEELEADLERLRRDLKKD